ncbi:MAG: hypothetical protein ACO1RX_10305 [Candidatus Sericytochromatia bacterium]
MTASPLIAWETPAELAQALTEGLRRRLTPLLLEQYLAGVLHFPLTSAEAQALRPALKPVLELLSRWQEPAPRRTLYRLPPRSLHLATLVSGWLNGGTQPEFHGATAPYRAHQLQSPLSFCLMQQVQLALRYMREGRSSLLASPERFDGWVPAARFQERLLRQSPLGLDSDDLGLALLRLAPERDGLWEAVQGHLPADPVHAAALQLALGSREDALEGLAPLLARLVQSPPDDWLLQARHYTAQPRDTAPNRLFRLLSRALICRCGLANASQELPILKQLRLDQLLVNAGVDYGQWQEASVRMMESLSELLKQGQQALLQSAELELPEVPQHILRLGDLPQKASLIQAFWHPDAQVPDPFASNPRMADVLEPLVLPYPHMAAHVICWLGEHHQPGHGLAFDAEEWVQPLAWYQPGLAARLWQLGLDPLRALPAGVSPARFSFAVALLAFGERDDVPVRPADLPPLLRTLSSRYSAHRQQSRRVLDALFASQRLDPAALIAPWTELICDLEQPWEWTRVGLQEWAVTGPQAGRALLQTFAQLWEGDCRLPRRRLASVLKLWQELATRQPADVVMRPSAEAALRACAEGAVPQLATLAQTLLAQGVAGT